MPKREQIIFNGKPSYGFNIDKPVGLRGSNHKGDVLLIQAMLRYVAVGFGSKEVVPELFSAFKVPEITGMFDSDTMMSINMYQVAHSKQLLKSDGTIHPASYGKRDINPFKPLMTITHLHMMCLVSAKKRGFVHDYTVDMLRFLPNLTPFIIREAFNL